MADKKFSSSYLDEIGSGFDAKGYDGPQLGKAETEAVAEKDNWTGDRRDSIGRAASIQRRKLVVARKLRRLANELEALERAEMDPSYRSTVEKADMNFDKDISEVIDDDAKGCNEFDAGTEASSDSSSSQPENLADEENYKNVTADNHPKERDPNKMDPAANESSQLGDDKWVDIGPGTFKDKRNEVGKAAD